MDNDAVFDGRPQRESGFHHATPTRQYAPSSPGLEAPGIVQRGGMKRGAQVNSISGLMCLCAAGTKSNPGALCIDLSCVAK